MAEITITQNNFDEEVLHSNVPVLLDFWADWCGPCRMLAPVIAEIAREQEGKVKVGKVNVDQEPVLAGRYGITSIPTILVFKNGDPVKAAVGVRPKQQLLDMLA